MSIVSREKVTGFRKKIYAYYREHPRSFPWRNTRNPYYILVSEVMLQQTQVDRAIPYYRAFLKRFPTIQLLAKAPLRDVLRVWSGLGYNRRAMYLREMAQVVCSKHKAHIPEEEAELRELPGIGPATAAAVRAFAWGLPTIYLDTNVRSVFLHEFFPRRKNVSDKEIMDLIEVTLDRKKPRIWYYALLDYGAALKKRLGNPNTRSKHYVKQKPFKGSDRELRGKVVQILLRQQTIFTKDFPKMLGISTESTTRILTSLAQDGFILVSQTRVALQKDE